MYKSVEDGPWQCILFISFLICLLKIISWRKWIEHAKTTGGQSNCQTTKKRREWDRKRRCEASPNSIVRMSSWPPWFLLLLSDGQAATMSLPEPPTFQEKNPCSELCTKHPSAQVLANNSKMSPNVVQKNKNQANKIELRLCVNDKRFVNILYYFKGYLY